MKSLLIFILFAFTFFQSLGQRNELVFQYKNADKFESAGKYLYIFKDSSESSQPSVIGNLSYFKKSNQDVPTLGVSSKNIWVKLHIQNLTESNSIFLALLQPNIDEVSLYEIESGHAKLIESTGEIIPYYNRKFKNQNYIFPVQIKKDEIKTYLFKIRTGEQISIPLKVGTQTPLYESLLQFDLVTGIYVGIILVMVFYNLFIYFSVRDKIYLIYVFYIIIVGITQTNFLGYNIRFLTPGNTWLSINGTYILSTLVGISAAQFMRFFLNTSQHEPKLDKFFYIFYWIYFISIILAFFTYYNASFLIIELNAMFLALYMLFIAYKINLKGYNSAKFFLIAWTIFLIGVVFFVLRDFGIFPYNTVTSYTMTLGSALEVMLLSFALADRINILKKEKEVSQAEAIRAMAENDRIIREQNIILESKVEERTSELQQSNQDLNKALTNLQEAQSQLVDAEKMASLGQLTAGIAHEINNPINFVSSSINPLKRDIQGLMQILEEYEKLHKHEPLNVNLKQIEKLKEDLEYDYLKEEIDMMLSGIAEGATRTAEIVKSLRNFSRLDEDALKPSDLNQGIDSTLVLLNNSMDGKVKISKCYNNIPAIECFPGKINQVFMNILTNSIQAVKAKDIADGEILISTFEKDELVGVSIKDNGIGMSEKTKMKIFEPFFTTKDVGEGTGLGLSIVYTIIESHKGKIEVNSEEGIGTEFILYLPKNLQSLK